MLLNGSQLQERSLSKASTSMEHQILLMMTTKSGWFRYCQPSITKHKNCFL
uniref:Uncharacterized protein n=1 Tax=Rhizophora mucronata TaxID=61149 RepID=A0A2P2P8L5_RHIMU